MFQARKCTHLFESETGHPASMTPHRAFLAGYGLPFLLLAAGVLLFALAYPAHALSAGARTDISCLHTMPHTENVSVAGKTEAKAPARQHPCGAHPHHGMAWPVAAHQHGHHTPHHKGCCATECLSMTSAVAFIHPAPLLLPASVPVSATHAVFRPAVAVNNGTVPLLRPPRLLFS